MKSVFEKVLFVGPDIKGRGGISSVLSLYSEMIYPFYYLSSNSRRGTLAGLLVLIKLLICLPFYRLIKGLKIVHIQGASGKSFVRKALIIRVSKLLGFKIVYHIHGGAFDSYVQQRGVKTVSKTLCRCDVLAVLTDKWKTYFETVFDHENVYVLNNPIKPMSIDYSVKNDGVLKLLFLGLICKDKGIYDLLEVIKENKEQLSGKLLLRVGGNGEVDNFIGMIDKYGLSDMVKYEGWVTGEHKKELLQTSDIFILPSYIEALPMSILEAMSCSKAIIATNVGGIPDIVNINNGVLFSPGDRMALKEAIVSYLNNPTKAVTQGVASKTMVEPYYLENVRADLCKMYKNIL